MYGIDIIKDYVAGFTKKVIDWTIFLPLMSFFLLIFLLTKLGFIPYSEFESILMLGFVVSPFLSRKLIWGVFYFFQFNSFVRILNSKITTKDDFRNAWLYYCRICHTDNLKRMVPGGIYLKYHLLGLYFNHSLKSLQINRTKGKFQDISYQEDLMFISFACIVCDFASSYDARRHYDIASELIENLGQISLEKMFRQIIKDCYNDGKGFLSTLALMLLIMIYLRLPNKKTDVVEFFTDISDLKIGWLNRRVFEAVIATVMIERTPKKELVELENELRNSQIVGLEDKYNFWDKVLSVKISHLGLENAD